MNLVVVRDLQGQQSMQGRLFVDGAFMCYTLEPARFTSPHKLSQKGCIPKGTFKLILTMSNRFKKVLPLLVGVPSFTGVRIHSGNTAHDTSGCLLLGMCRTDKGLLRSSEAVNLLISKLSLKGSWAIAHKIEYFDSIQELILSKNVDAALIFHYYAKLM